MLERPFFEVLKEIDEVLNEVNEMKKILCLDFDGVIHSYVHPWDGPTVIPDPPVEGAFDFIREAMKEFDVQVFSTRSTMPGGIEAMKAWFLEWDPTPSFRPLVFDLKFPTEKPPAFVSLDDRCLLFEGIWPSIEKLKNFEPWNKRGA